MEAGYERDFETELHGWRFKYVMRRNSHTRRGALYIRTPRRGGSSRVIRSMVMLLEELHHLERTAKGSAWVPPRVRDLIEVEVVDSGLPANDNPPADASAEWRLAEVRQVLPDGQFMACVFDAYGMADEDFMEWFSKHDEGTDWRRRAAE
ncbi:MAG: hypothetical protein SGPRY_013556, partial [Prymnesium sp.]